MLVCVRIYLGEMRKCKKNMHNIVFYKNNNLKSIFNDVIQEINKITIDEKALPQDKFRNPYVVCLEYLSKYGYSIKTIEWE